jgi:LuxR family maltose regulon positive regulatory protein
VVNRIERDQLFVIPLDNRREWYRYHHLFADVLEKELHHFEPARVAELHRRAARWYADHDFAVEAVQHALASGDIALAAELVVAYSMPVCWQGQVHTVLGWFIALGEELCRGDARLAIAGFGRRR